MAARAAARPLPEHIKYPSHRTIDLLSVSGMPQRMIHWIASSPKRPLVAALLGVLTVTLSLLLASVTPTAPHLDRKHASTDVAPDSDPVVVTPCVATKPLIVASSTPKCDYSARRIVHSLSRDIRTASQHSSAIFALLPILALGTPPPSSPTTTTYVARPAQIRSLLLTPRL